MVKIPNRIKIMFSIFCGSSCEGWSLKGEEKSGLGEASALLLLFFLLLHRTDLNLQSFSYRKKAGLVTVSALDLDDCKLCVRFVFCLFKYSTKSNQYYYYEPNTPLRIPHKER